MTSHHFRKRPVAVALLTAALALSGTVATTAAAQAAPRQTTAANETEFDYFAQNIPGLRHGSVFEAVTYERFDTLLKREGNYALLIGGPNDPRVQAAAASIDTAAQQYGVEKIYAFDPLLDGKSVDVCTSSIESVRQLWANLLPALNADTTPQFGAGSDPYLVIYNKDHRQGETEDRIVASLTALPGDEGFAEALDGVLSSVATNGQAAVATQTQFEFFRDQMNGRHQASYKDADAYGSVILGEDQATNFALKSITYPELVDLLETPGDHTILFGGTWCHNTRAVAHEINDRAIAAGTDTVYVFDLRLDSQYVSNSLHIRDNAANSPLSYLYGDLVTQYLPGLRTQYQLSSENPGHKVSFYPGGDSAQPLAVAPKLQVPYLVRYNKDAAAPVLKDWVQVDQAGVVKEFMTEFWWIEGLPGSRSSKTYPATAQGDADWAANQQKQWAFAEAALTELDVFFGLNDGDQGDSDATGTADASGTGDAGGTANSGGTASGGSDATGESGVEGAQQPSPVLSVSDRLSPGAAFTLSGKGLPADTEVRVELHSTPQLLGNATVGAGGTFTFASRIPAATPAGSHHLVVFAEGREVARVAVQVNSNSANNNGANGAASSLATTGVESGLGGALGAAAAALGIAGAGLILARRKFGQSSAR